MPQKLLESHKNSHIRAPSHKLSGRHTRYTSGLSGGATLIKCLKGKNGELKTVKPWRSDFAPKDHHLVNNSRSHSHIRVSYQILDEASLKGPQWNFLYTGPDVTLSRPRVGHKDVKWAWEGENDPTPSLSLLEKSGSHSQVDSQSDIHTT